MYREDFEKRNLLYLVSNCEEEGFIKVAEEKYINKEILKDIRIVDCQTDKRYIEMWYKTSIILIVPRDSLVSVFRTILSLKDF